MNLITALTKIVLNNMSNKKERWNSSILFDSPSKCIDIDENLFDSFNSQVNEGREALNSLRRAVVKFKLRSS